MALEISEIGIHLRVPDEGGAPAGSGGDEGAGASGGGGMGEEERTRLVEECVRRVLGILAMRAER